MNRNKFVVLVIAGVCIKSTIEYLKMRNEEIKKREEIQAKLAKDLRAIAIGAERIKEKLHSGEYKPRDIDELMTDLRFEQLTAYNEQ